MKRRTHPLAALLLGAIAGGCLATPQPIEPSPTAALPTPAPDAIPSATHGPGPVASPVVVASPDVGPSAVTAPPDAPPLGDASCPLAEQPGPADAAPTEGDLTDWSHIFGGRVRICLGAPTPIELEGRAECTWNDTLDEVRDATGLPVAVAGSGSIDGALALDRRVVSIGRTLLSGEVGSWEARLGPDDLRRFDHGRRGIARFVADALTDPEHPPAVRPPDVVGLIRWSCLEPVAP